MDKIKNSTLGFTRLETELQERVEFLEESERLYEEATGRAVATEAKLKTLIVAAKNALSALETPVYGCTTTGESRYVIEDLDEALRNCGEFNDYE